jgi:hypothetical protein
LLSLKLKPHSGICSANALQIKSHSTFLQPRERRQEPALLLEQELLLLALQRAAAERKRLEQASQQPYSDSQQHFQTYIIDTH